MLPRRTHTAYVTAATPRGGAGRYDKSTRDALVEAHLPQVKFIAERLAAKLPPSVELDDLIGAGVVGLLDAVEKFDPARGVQFKTYAELRVRGAMLDCLRALDWAPRALRQRAREVEAAYRQLEQKYGRPAEEEEIAAVLAISVADYRDLLNELQGLTEGDALVNRIPDDVSRTPLALYERAEGQTTLIAAIDRLPARERQVVALYYLEELTMKEVGAVLGITESRVSQLHTQAVLRLRASLQGKLAR
jgi:RNA polymerase sigma factor FliA